MEKNILFITFGYPDKKNRGKFLFSHEQVSALINDKDNKLKVDVLDLMPDYEVKNQIIDELFENIRVIRLKYPSLKKTFFKFIIFKLKLKSFLKQNKTKYDIILFNFINPTYYFILNLFRNIKIKTIIAHGFDAMIKWDRWFIALIKKRLLKKVNLVFCVSDATACFASYGIPKKQVSKIKIVYNGIELKKFHNIIKKRKKDIRKNLKIEPDIPVFLTVCNLVKRKGVDIVLDAINILNVSNIHFKHYIIGRGVEEKKLKKMVKRNNLTDKVIFIPYIENDEELMSYFAAADIFIMMSRTLYKPPSMEGFGIVYAEAQYLGVPVIAGKSGGVPSVVRDGFTGYLLNPEKKSASKEIVEKVKILLNDKEKYKWISNNAKNFIKENFSWGKNAREIIGYLKDMYN